MNWDAALAAADLVTASFFDTTAFRAIPMARPPLQVQADFRPDPDRERFNFMGTIELDPSVNAIGSTEHSTSRSLGDRKVARICLSALATGWPWMLRQGDLLESGGNRYKVSAAPDRDGTDRVVIWLNRVQP